MHLLASGRRPRGLLVESYHHPGRASPAARLATPAIRTGRAAVPVVQGGQPAARQLGALRGSRGSSLAYHHPYHLRGEDQYNDTDVVGRSVRTDRCLEPAAPLTSDQVVGGSIPPGAPLVKRGFAARMRTAPELNGFRRVYWRFSEHRNIGHSASAVARTICWHLTPRVSGSSSEITSMSRILPPSGARAVPDPRTQRRLDVPVRGRPGSGPGRTRTRNRRRNRRDRLRG